VLRFTVALDKLPQVATGRIIALSSRSSGRARVVTRTVGRSCWPTCWSIP